MTTKIMTTASIIESFHFEITSHLSQATRSDAPTTSLSIKFHLTWDPFNIRLSCPQLLHFYLMSVGHTTNSIFIVGSFQVSSCIISSHSNESSSVLASLSIFQFLLLLSKNLFANLTNSLSTCIAFSIEYSNPKLKTFLL